jgi:hypothetical protein
MRIPLRKPLGVGRDPARAITADIHELVSNSCLLDLIRPPLLLTSSKVPTSYPSPSGGKQHRTGFESVLPLGSRRELLQRINQSGHTAILTRLITRASL